MWRRWWRRSPEQVADDAAADRIAESNSPAFTAAEEELLDRIALATARWGMTVPAVFLLESSKPLNFVGSQFLHFLSPIAHSVLDARQLDRLAVLLERRETVEELIVRIERADAGGRGGADRRR